MPDVCLETDQNILMGKRKYDKWTNKAKTMLFKSIIRQDNISIIDWKLVSYELSDNDDGCSFQYSSRSCYDHFTQFKKVSYKLGFDDARYLLKLLYDNKFIWKQEILGPDVPELRNKLSKIMGIDIHLSKK